MCGAGEPRITCYHEAGHAVVALLLGLRALRVEWSPSAVTRSTGESEIEAAPPGQSDPPPTQMLNRLITCVAGMVAERRCQGWPADIYNLVGDFESACDLIATLYPDVEPKPLFSAALITAEALLSQATAWAAVEALAAAVLARRQLLESAILEVVRPTGLLNRV
ncbi:MAG: hypothetical protein ACLQU5_13150 [Isosphaeraceae bacterium]